MRAETNTFGIPQKSSEVSTPQIKLMEVKTLKSSHSVWAGVPQFINNCTFIKLVILLKSWIVSINGGLC